MCQTGLMAQPSSRSGGLVPIAMSWKWVPRPPPSLQRPRPPPGARLQPQDTLGQNHPARPRLGPEPVKPLAVSGRHVLGCLFYSNRRRIHQAGQSGKPAHVLEPAVSEIRPLSPLHAVSPRPSAVAPRHTCLGQELRQHRNGVCPPGGSPRPGTEPAGSVQPRNRLPFTCPCRGQSYV